MPTKHKKATRTSPCVSTSHTIFHWRRVLKVAIMTQTINMLERWTNARLSMCEKNWRKNTRIVEILQEYLWRRKGDIWHIPSSRSSHPRVAVQFILPSLIIQFFDHVLLPMKLGPIFGPIHILYEGLWWGGIHTVGVIENIARIANAVQVTIWL